MRTGAYNCVDMHVCMGPRARAHGCARARVRVRARVRACVLTRARALDVSEASSSLCAIGPGRAACSGLLLLVPSGPLSPASAGRRAKVPLVPLPSKGPLLSPRT